MNEVEPSRSVENVRLSAGLRRLRQSTGLSLAALADKTVYSKSSWERYLNGKKLPPRGAVEALCRLAGEHPGRLLALWELAEPAWAGRARSAAPGAPSRGTGAVPPGLRGGASAPLAASSSAAPASSTTPTESVASGEGSPTPARPDGCSVPGPRQDTKGPGNAYDRRHADDRATVDEPRTATSPEPAASGRDMAPDRRFERHQKTYDGDDAPEPAPTKERAPARGTARARDGRDGDRGEAPGLTWRRAVPVLMRAVGGRAGLALAVFSAVVAAVVATLMASAPWGGAWWNQEGSGARSGAGTQAGGDTVPSFAVLTGCQGKACDGKNPMSMSCGREGAVSTVLERTTAGNRQVQLRYSTACGAAWGRMRSGRIGDRMEVAVRGGPPKGAEVLDRFDAEGYFVTPMAAVGRPSGIRLCLDPVGRAPSECFLTR
ncbi:DUF2690 domain-containing protein [Streptomyces sp. NPDC003077]|uniref:XRE family transcriptional regulator n=1 Tax=Streptomyces sp. NPDC003077 TaxID=3154443 RepID=UPI0033BB3E6A